MRPRPNRAPTQPRRGSRTSPPTPTPGLSESRIFARSSGAGWWAVTNSRSILAGQIGVLQRAGQRRSGTVPRPRAGGRATAVPRGARAVDRAQRRRHFSGLAGAPSHGTPSSLPRETCARRARTRRSSRRRRCARGGARPVESCGGRSARTRPWRQHVQLAEVAGERADVTQLGRSRPREHNRDERLRQVGQVGHAQTLGRRHTRLGTSAIHVALVPIPERELTNAPPRTTDPGCGHH